MSKINRVYETSVPNGVKQVAITHLTFAGPPALLTATPDYATGPAEALGGGFISIRQFVARKTFLADNAALLLLAVNPDPPYAGQQRMYDCTEV
jgi:hypothetical protein